MNENVIVTPLFGYFKLDTRMRPVMDGMVGEGRSMEYDMDGNLIHDTGWQPTGCRLYWNGCMGDEQP